jgi:hypothetical protein
VHSIRVAVVSVLLATTSARALAQAPDARLEEAKRQRGRAIAMVVLGGFLLTGGVLLVLQPDKDTPCQGDVGRCIGTGIRDNISNGARDIAGYTFIGGGGLLALVGGVAWSRAAHQIAAENAVRVTLAPVRSGGALVVGGRF